MNWNSFLYFSLNKLFLQKLQVGYSFIIIIYKRKNENTADSAIIQSNYKGSWRKKNKLYWKVNTDHGRKVQQWEAQAKLKRKVKAQHTDISSIQLHKDPHLRMRTRRPHSSTYSKDIGKSEHIYSQSLSQERSEGIPLQLPKIEQNQLPADCGHPLRRSTHTSTKGSIAAQNCICS